MSELGQTRSYRNVHGRSALPPRAEIVSGPSSFRRTVFRPIMVSPRKSAPIPLRRVSGWQPERYADFPMDDSGLARSPSASLLRRWRAQAARASRASAVSRGRGAPRLTALENAL